METLCELGAWLLYVSLALVNSEHTRYSSYIDQTDVGPTSTTVGQHLINKWYKRPVLFLDNVPMMAGFITPPHRHVNTSFRTFSLLAHCADMIAQGRVNWIEMEQAEVQ